MPIAPLRLIKQCIEWREFKPDKMEINKIPAHTRGIYVLFKEKKPRKVYDVMYIGMAGAPKAGVDSRLRRHSKSERKSKLCTHFSIFEVHDNVSKEEISELEGILRHIFRKDSHANQLAHQLGYGKLRRKDVSKEEMVRLEACKLKIGNPPMAQSRNGTIPQILHVDMDAFFVSVEELENPSLRGKAVVVGADPEGRGVVAAASYEARKYGVHSAMPIRTAKKLCPQAIFLRGHHAQYREYSEKIYDIFSEFTPVVEMVSIDEAYLDLTGTERLHGGALQAADRLIRAVQARTGLNCSVGASTSHLVSKIASDQAKPHGLLCVFPGYEAAFLAPLPIRRMPGIGKVAEPELLELGLATIGDLQAYGRQNLKQRFGKYGEWLWIKSRGEDIEAYQYGEEPKSISHETTFDVDTADADEIERTLSYLAQRVAGRLRDQGFFARTVGLKLRNARFRTLTRDVTLDEPTHLDSVIFESVLRLFEQAWKKGEKIRLVGVRASNLERGVFQRNLLEAPARAKLDRAMEAADKLRAKFGFHAVQLARSLEPEKRATAGRPAGLGKPAAAGKAARGAEQPKELRKRQFLGRKD